MSSTEVVAINLRWVYEYQPFFAYCLNSHWLWLQLLIEYQLSSLAVLWFHFLSHRFISKLYLAALFGLKVMQFIVHELIRRPKASIYIDFKCLLTPTLFILVLSPFHSWFVQPNRLHFVSLDLLEQDHPWLIVVIIFIHLIRCWDCLFKLKELLES